MQGEYLQQREYGSIPSFARTQRIGVAAATEASDSDGLTMTDEGEQASPAHHVYSILPVDVSAEGFLPTVKQRLEHLHPSQRDYVSAQLLHEDCAYLKQLIALFLQLEDSRSDASLVW